MMSDLVLTFSDTPPPKWFVSIRVTTVDGAYSKSDFRTIHRKSADDRYHFRFNFKTLPLVPS